MSARAHRPIVGPLLIASHNPGKIGEMQELLAPYGVDVVSAGELGLAAPEETGTSFRENALIKAARAAQAAGLPSFADDSGLVVVALGGEPGIHSARWAGPARDFAAAMAEVELLVFQRDFAGARRHVGLYAYRVGALERLAQLPRGQLEAREQLEQLRALEHGLKVYVADAQERPGPDVNTLADLERVSALMSRGAP